MGLLDSFGTPFSNKSASLNGVPTTFRYFARFKVNNKRGHSVVHFFFLRAITYTKNVLVHWGFRSSWSINLYLKQAHSSPSRLSLLWYIVSGKWSTYALYTCVLTLTGPTSSFIIDVILVYNLVGHMPYMHSYMFINFYLFKYSSIQVKICLLWPLLKRSWMCSWTRWSGYTWLSRLKIPNNILIT